MMFVKIGITRMSGQLVMREVRIAQLFPCKTSIKRQQHRADRPVQPGLAGDKRAMHGIMADDEHANGKPALHQRKRQCERPI